MARISRVDVAQIGAASVQPITDDLVGGIGGRTPCGSATYPGQTYFPVFNAVSPVAITKMYLGYTGVGTLTVQSGDLNASDTISVSFGTGNAGSSGTWIQSGGNVTASAFKVGNWGTGGQSGFFNMSGGTITTTANVELGNNTLGNTFNMSDGIIKAGSHLRWGVKGATPTAYISGTMSGGSIESVSMSFHWADLTFSGGTIKVTGTPVGETFIPVKWEPTAHVYFYGGTMLLNSDRTLDVAQWITDGKMLTHKEFGWHVASSYDELTGYMTVSSVVPEPGSAVALFTGLVGWWGSRLEDVDRAISQTTGIGSPVENPPGFFRGAARLVRWLRRAASD